MTTKEFPEWLAFHMSRFTGVSAWLSRFPTAPRFEGDPTQRSVRDSWEDAMRGVPLADAKEATLQMFRGDSEAPKVPDEHPKCVCSLAAKIGASRVAARNAAADARRNYGGRFDGEPTYSCLTCMDEGAVFIYHPLSVVDMRQGQVKHHVLNPTGKRQLCTATAICRCDAGRRFGNREDGEYFNDLKNYPVGKWTLESRYRELQELVSSETLVPGCKEF